MTNDLPTLELVPGDDWPQRVSLSDPDGNPANFSGWTVEVATITWSGGSINPVTVDLANAAIGVFDLSATETQTVDVPMGPMSILTLKLRSPSGIDTTVYAAMIKGVFTRSALTATAVVPGAPGFPTSVTISPNTPSGGVDGDLWLQVPST